MAVTWSYAGSTSIQVTLDTLSGHSYTVSVVDGATNNTDTFSGTGSPMTRIISGLSGLTAGDLFGGFVQDDTAGTMADGTNFVYGTASSGGAGVTSGWAYDGADTISLTFTGSAGHSYNLQIDYYDSVPIKYEEYGTPFTATGSSQTVTLAAINTPANGLLATIWLAEGTYTSIGSKTLEAGVAVIARPVVIPDGRVLIAFDDGPLEPNPTWTAIDQGGSFPPQLVAGYDTESGRQTLQSQTDTGTARVYLNDRDGLFDPNNHSGPYFGKFSGRQILLQLYDPVTTTWQSQFRGWIDSYTYNIDGSAVDPNGDPLNANIQIDCVDVFDYLGGFGLTPGLDGVKPPVGGEDGIWYAETGGSVDDRIIEILTDVGIDESRYIVFSGNVRVQEVKYDPDESALTALRDACDAEFPFIANMYVDRFGRFVFHGRYSRFDPDGVAARTDPARWTFNRWPVGDGKAIQSDPARTQIRVLEYARSRENIINVAVAYPAKMKPAQMRKQVFADTSSLTFYGKHQAPPMSDLLTKHGTYTGNDANKETFLYAKLLVKNQAFPRDTITALQLKSLRPDDPRGPNVWAMLTTSDISDIVNVKVGYPGGTGFAGDSPDDDYFIEGRQLQVRPLEPGFDYVTLDLEVSPAVWSMDTHSVFGLTPGPGAELVAEFTYE